MPADLLRPSQLGSKGRPKGKPETMEAESRQCLRRKAHPETAIVVQWSVLLKERFGNLNDNLNACQKWLVDINSFVNDVHQSPSSKSY